jgi:hypothetical protein
VALYLISYDIDEKDKAEYEPLWALLKEMRATRILWSEWVIPRDSGSAVVIYDRIMPLLKTADRLLVQELTVDASWDKLLISDDAFRKLLVAFARR